MFRSIILEIELFCGLNLREEISFLNRKNRLSKVTLLNIHQHSNAFSFTDCNQLKIPNSRSGLGYGQVNLKLCSRDH
jgi:hypothetical protein